MTSCWGLMLDTKHPDMTRLISSRTTLNFEEWNLIHQARLGISRYMAPPATNLPTKAADTALETTAHVLNACPTGMAAMTEIHEGLLDRLAKSIEKAGHKARINRSWEEGRLRPDLVITSMDPIIIIDVTVPFDEPDNLLAAHAEKVRKYSHLGTTLPFVVGSLGSWFPTNDHIAATLGITPRSWNSVRRDTRLLADVGLSPSPGSTSAAKRTPRCTMIDRYSPLPWFTPRPPANSQ